MVILKVNTILILKVNATQVIKIAFTLRIKKLHLPIRIKTWKSKMIKTLTFNNKGLKPFLFEKYDFFGKIKLRKKRDNEYEKRNIKCYNFRKEVFIKKI